MKQKDEAAIIKRIEGLKTKLEKADRDYAKSYEIMYKMLESTEN